MNGDLRKLFPIFQKNKDLIYLDNAATSQRPQVVLDRMMEYYTEYNANVHRGYYPLADRATEEYESARKKVARFINAEPEEIIFTASATDGLNKIARTLDTCDFMADNPRVVLTDFEHHSSMLPWQPLQPEVIQYLGIDDNYELKDTKLMPDADVLATVHVSNVTGTIIPIKEIIIKNPYPYTVLDATQSLAHMPVDVKDMDIDFMAFSAHKMYGPIGIGVIYAKKEILKELCPFNLGGGMVDEVTREGATWKNAPGKFEAGTPNIAGAIGLGAAIDFIKEIGFDVIQQHEQALRHYALDKLSELDEIIIYHPRDREKGVPLATGVISFSMKDIHAHDIAHYLGERSICLRAGHHCTQVLHREVLKVGASTRLSLALYNTEADIDAFILALKECLQLYKKK